jgi:hypothetical protein
MIAAWIVAVVAVLGVIGLGLRISYQVGSLTQEFRGFKDSSDQVHKDQERRIRLLEARPVRR